MDNVIFKKPKLYLLFHYCLLTANHKPQKFLYDGELFTIGAGELVTTLSEIHKRTGIPRTTIHRGLKTLSRMGTITLKKLKSNRDPEKRNDEIEKAEQRLTLISIVNWDIYQAKRNDSGTTKRKRRNDSGTTPLAKPYLARACGANNNVNNVILYIATKDRLETVINALNLPQPITESASLFINRVRQGNATRRISLKRAHGIVQELLAIADKYGKGNLITAINRTLLKNGFNWSGRNVVGYTKAIAKNLHAQEQQEGIQKRSRSDKEALREAKTGGLYKDIEDSLNGRD